MAHKKILGCKKEKKEFFNHKHIKEHKLSEAVFDPEHQVSGPKHKLQLNVNLMCTSLNYPIPRQTVVLNQNTTDTTEIFKDQILNGVVHLFSHLRCRLCANIHSLRDAKRAPF
jgi:hypothetical protein